MLEFGSCSTPTGNLGISGNIKSLFQVLGSFLIWGLVEATGLLITFQNALPGCHREVR